MTVGIGLNRWDWRSPAAFAQCVARGEAAGISHAFVPVNPLAVWDPWVLMATGAAATSTMRFGTLLDTPMLRPPAMAAGSLATLQEVSGGRAMMTYGVGDTAVRWLGMRPARIAEVESAVRQARGYLRGDRIEVGAARPAFLRHARPGEVWVAASGPRSIRMAGRVADGVFIRVGTAPANLRAAIAALRAGAEEAGRDHDEIAVALIVHTIRNQNPDEIRAISRAMAAGFYEYAPALFEQAGFEWSGTPIHELKRQVWPDFHHAADLVAAGRVVDSLSDEIAGSFSFFGTGRDVADQMTAVLDEVPQARLIVPHPVPMPIDDEVQTYVDWLGRHITPVLSAR